MRETELKSNLLSAGSQVRTAFSLSMRFCSLSLRGEIGKPMGQEGRKMCCLAKKAA